MARGRGSSIDTIAVVWPLCPRVGTIDDWAALKTDSTGVSIDPSSCLVPWTADRPFGVHGVSCPMRRRKAQDHDRLSGRGHARNLDRSL
jgi:hypothetical protein